MFNLPCSSILDWCFDPSLHWTLWTDHEQLICVRHSISREEAEYWHVISLYQSVHILFYFWKFPNYINHILLYYLLNPRLGKYLKCQTCFLRHFEQIWDYVELVSKTQCLCDFLEVWPCYQSRGWCPYMFLFFRHKMLLEVLFLVS